MNSDNIVARLDATFENTLRFDAELQAVYVVEKSNILYNTTAGWNSQSELVAKAGYLYVYIDYKQTEDNQNIAGFKVGDNTSLLIDSPFTDSIIYTSIEDIENGLNEIGYAIESLNTNKVNNVNPSTSGALSHTGNAIVTGTMTAQEGFIGNLDGKATSAENADTVNNLSVLTAVPENAKFTDTDKLANLKDVSFTNPTEGQIPKYNAEAEKWENVDDNKLDKNNPTGTGAFSLNRKAETTIGSNSFVEGYDNTASGSCAHAEGQGTTASGNNGSHAEGRQTTASGLQSHAEGYATTAAGAYSHAEGSATHTGLTALASHAEGSSTTASGANSHAEGEGTTASGKDSHAGGHGTIAKNLSQHVFGEFNIQDPANKSSTVRGTYVEIVGNGTNTNTRSNARTLDWSGNETLAGGLTASGNIDVKDSEGNTKISLNGSTGDISCTSINGVAPTEVVANPSDEGSADLTKIKIGNNIYDIPQGGSGGHTIVDDNGTSLTQRTKLQFNGAYSEDNATDDTTKINVIREMKKAEFDELTEAEKTGLINITDITGGNDDRFQPVIFSTEEREIGVWKDGKPLYQKTFIKTITCGSEQTLLDTTDLQDVDVIVDIFGNYGVIKLEHYDSSNYRGYVTLAGSFVIGYVKWGTTSSLTATVTIQYTKTTDQAGSGQWTPQGVPAHHYSTDEQVVGTWIDGNTLYQRTLIHLGTLSSVGDWTVYDDTISYGALTKVESVRYTTSGEWVPFTQTLYTNPRFSVQDNHKLYYYSAEDISSIYIYITIQYTKYTV